MHIGEWYPSAVGERGIVRKWIYVVCAINVWGIGI